MRLPAEEGLSPSPSTITPALTSSSLNLPIASNISVISSVGGRPFSLSSVAFTKTITRIFRLLLIGADIGSCLDDERAIAKSTRARKKFKRRRRATVAQNKARRSEEHTSELQSLMRISYAVFCLKKKTRQQET